MSNTQKHRFLYLHSGGVTSLLNHTLYTLYKHALINNATCFVSPLGIIGAIHDTFVEIDETLSSLTQHTPASTTGSSRYNPSDRDITLLLDNLLRHNISSILIHGGDDSQKTLLRIQNMVHLRQLNIQCIGLPKTIDNDLVGIHTSPGYASSAKYLAISFMEAAWDMMAMHNTSTKVFVIETMGRDSGWLAAATTLATHRYDIPNILCVPEHLHSKDTLERKIRQHIQDYGYCTLSLAEGYPFEVIEASCTDPFGHPQLGYQGSLLTAWIEKTIKVKTRYARPDCLQRSAGHAASAYDWHLSEAIAIKAIQTLFTNHSGIMIGTKTYDIKSISYIPLEEVVNKSYQVPSTFLTESGDQTTKAFVDYLEPIITGEVALPYERGLPIYSFPIFNITQETAS